jgi:hypothetical protein
LNLDVRAENRTMYVQYALCFVCHLYDGCG